MKSILTFILMFLALHTFAQDHFSRQELSINGYRNPSVGLEYRYGPVSVHAGYYPTALEAGENTNFFKTGVTAWFLPIGQRQNPSSFYAGINYLRGYTRDYKGKNAMGMEAGFRWMAWKGLNVRIGIIAVASEGQSLKVNPASGISYSFFFN